MSISVSHRNESLELTNGWYTYTDPYIHIQLSIITDYEVSPSDGNSGF